MGSPSIIVLDDDPEELELLTYCHRSAALSQPLLCFEKADSLVGHLRRVQAGDCPQPCIVLIDVHLIGADGFELVERLSQEFPGLSHLVLLSNARLQKDVQRAAKLGVELYAKPRGLKDTISLLRELVL